MKRLCLNHSVKEQSAGNWKASSHGEGVGVLKLRQHTLGVDDDVPAKV
jgi:hypothetical protein